MHDPTTGQTCSSHSHSSVLKRIPPAGQHRLAVNEQRLTAFTNRADRAEPWGQGLFFGKGREKAVVFAAVQERTKTHHDSVLHAEVSREGRTVKINRDAACPAEPCGVKRQPVRNIHHRRRMKGTRLEPRRNQGDRRKIAPAPRGAQAPRFWPVSEGRRDRASKDRAHQRRRPGRLPEPPLRFTGASPRRSPRAVTAHTSSLACARSPPATAQPGQRDRARLHALRDALKQRHLGLIGARECNRECDRSGAHRDDVEGSSSQVSSRALRDWSVETKIVALDHRVGRHNRSPRKLDHGAVVAGPSVTADPPRKWGKMRASTAASPSAPTVSVIPSTLAHETVQLYELRLSRASQIIHSSLGLCGCRNPLRGASHRLLRSRGADASSRECE